jgi:hypothetical protein
MESARRSARSNSFLYCQSRMEVEGKAACRQDAKGALPKAAALNLKRLNLNGRTQCPKLTLSVV